MDGTPHLLTDVKFSERRRGYDPDEVDNFLERVSAAVAQLQDKLRQATARAEEADKRIADAERAQAVAEAQVDKLKADLEAARAAAEGRASEAPDDDSGADAAAKVLALAQRTADAAVADARAKAASVVAEAERTAERTVEEARRRAEELVAERQRTVLEEVRGLEELRRQLEADVEALRAHLERQFEVLRGGVEALQRLVADPDTLRVLPSPPLSGASSAGLAPPAGEPVVATREGPAGGDAAPTEPVAASDGAAGEDLATGEEPAGSGSTGDAGAATGGGGPPSGTAGPDAGTGPEVEPVGGPGGHGVEEELTVAVVATEVVAAPEDGAGEARPAGSGDVEPPADALFPPSEPDEPPTGSPATELFSPLGTPDASEDSPLGAPDREADEAMRAFFEADFEEPKGGRSRFGRRR
jgi:DivIVA domain-containing protein